ncbi:MAG TPA: hypothetical protein ENK75_02980, partial [Saprospiraceae bacterium]|nr:hypothetical protein [Saprospiraceae bacterium]
GFKVKLEDCNGLVLDSVLTDAEGKFNFENLKPGQYKLIFVLPDTMKFVEANIGGDDSKDSDADPSTGLTPCEELESGEKNKKYDAGVYVPAEIGDFVWEDLNANGIQDSNEPGIPNVSVILNDCQGNPIDTTSTDNDGYYLFDDLKPGNYKISLIIPDDYYLTNPDMTSDDKDSDIQNDGYTVCEIIESGEKNHTYDIGLYKFASIGDKVWEDKNANGIQENGEPGVEGVTVELRSCNGVFLTSTTTDVSGNYLFENLMPGSYKVKFILLNDYYFSPANMTTDDIDSDPNTISGLTVCEELLSGEENLTYDAGIYKLAKIGDKVWRDEDGDGIQDSNEPGFENVEIVLQDCDGNDISNQFTDPNGNYLFVDLVPGGYRLKFIPPQDYSFTYKDAGEDDVDSDVDPVTNLTICEALESGEDNRTYDGGLLYFGSLGDYVWEDINGDGIQQANEPPVENVELKLFFWENNQFVYKSNTYTDNNGLYLFNNLPPGDYYIKIIPPTDYEITVADREFDDSVDSDFDDYNGSNTTQVINLSPGEDDMTWDAGLFKCATIGDLLWRDHIRDDVYNVGEAGINGETVNLWRNDGGSWVLWDQVVTSYKPSSTCGDGFWSFCTNPGQYFIEFSGLANTNMVHVAPNVGTNDDIDSDIDDSNGINTSPVFTLSSGDFIDNLDAGYYPNYTLSGVAWKDANTNGINDQGEEKFAGITVELHNNSGIVASQITDNNGSYSFANLNEDQYYIWFELPTNNVFTTPNVGSDNSDSDVTDDNGANT